MSMPPHPSESTPSAPAPPAVVRSAEEEEEERCVQLKANYDQCFDQWYKDVFLQLKSNGQVGCQHEYAEYSMCFVKQLRRDKALMDGIAGVMNDDMKKRWDAHLTAFAPPEEPEQSKHPESNATSKANGSASTTKQ